MKTQQFLQSLSQQLRQWQRQYKILFREGKCQHKLHRNFFNHLLLYLSAHSHQGKQGKRGQTQKSTAKLVRKTSGIDKVIFRWVHQKRSSIILVLAILSLTSVVGNNLYNQPRMKVDNIALQTFIAPYSDNIEDRQETEQQRQNAIDRSAPILMIDNQINEEINQHLEEILDKSNQLRGIVGIFPFADTSRLSTSTQRYLRTFPESEWQQLKGTLGNNRKQNLKKQNSKLLLLPQSSINSKKLSSSSNFPVLPLPSYGNYSDEASFIQALSELEADQFTASASDFSELITQISQVRQGYNQAIKKASQLETGQVKKIYIEPIILDLTDNDWLKTQTGINKIAERILAQGISAGLPKTILNNTVSLQVELSVPSEAEPLAKNVLLAVLKPNIKQDEAQTKQQDELVANKIPSVMMQVKKGEIIVSKGEKITIRKFQVLEHYRLIVRQVNWLGLTGVSILITLVIGIFVWLERKSHNYLRQRDRLLVLLLTISVPGVLAMSLPYTTWSAIGLLLGSFYGPTIGMTVVGLLSLLLPITTDTNILVLLAGAAGGMLSSYVAHRLRSREELALLGVITALTQGGVFLLLKILTGGVFGSGWYIFQEAGLFAVSGLSWSIVALGLSPYLETLFDVITPIRLAELANPNRPLLKRLATETPGTFQHTLLVATLAEAAAKQLGCNVELVRAGTLYHDIGKMHDPLGFIENQIGSPNKHETEIKDPWESAKLIKKHVTEGLVMAKKHSLPTAIQAFIPEHQGTMAIAYFYHQAQQIAQENPHIIVNKADFCYDGPIPQSRETGIVMLADSCEAALRSLKDATPEKALNMLNNILKAKWQDEQLIDSGLTREEMPRIAQIFVDVWQQFHHKRIAYPKSKAGNS
ncbi:HDIG domain-containing protein [Dolichospermum sp. ST_sed1]|nr:HDIG domain-containing protein [Dolichospermum sp. ST_sed1]MDD1423415.1 HDIG domain-containing protein [Dolichospermum sp. ST_sed9]MDD1431562.1 HDIG domain-containing protein [Dolichospermum sp. ST_sed6]MDD1436175.1 HDIG domain-containing protein [Dolichospermum sp. ST_sed10]MDD1439014.1 HDIG domain-containing protein [Dolichospermum sp. ST_sed3]MDD1445729.1 HDIG domain-containing protein [Dolichospermum sp. ST_sed8]MDD1456516.1 HDIG domain-containing protein [Dolichospermum sp. ST_sed7]M